MNGKKIILLTVLLVFTLNVWGQTWTVRDDEQKAEMEYTVITLEQFNRLLKQYEASNEYCVMKYVDVLEKKQMNVISGKQPEFNGYYYILGKRKTNKLTKEEQTAFNLVGMTNVLVYGNSKTGSMNLIFTSSYGAIIPGAVMVGTNEYVNRFNNFIEFVKGEVENKVEKITYNIDGRTKTVNAILYAHEVYCLFFDYQYPQGVYWLEKKSSYRYYNTNDKEWEKWSKWEVDSRTPIYSIKTDKESVIMLEKALEMSIEKKYEESINEDGNKCLIEIAKQKSGYFYYDEDNKGYYQRFLYLIVD